MDVARVGRAGRYLRTGRNRFKTLAWGIGLTRRTGCLSERRSWSAISINTSMSTSAPWPTNSYGTSWRSVAIWFQWSDEAIIWEAIETIDSLKVTARIQPMVIVGFEGDGWLPVSDFVKIVQNGR